MHPVLTRPRALLFYLASWVPIAGLLALLLARSSELPPALAAAVAAPLAIVYAFLCLAGWYVCRALPLRTTPVVRLVAAHAVAAAISSSLWVVVAIVLGRAVTTFGGGRALESWVARERSLLFVVGVLLFALAVAVHYLFAAYEAARHAESRALEARVLATEAELRALRSQIDPHFLFNCLHSIGALASSDPAAARRMSQLLADFLRSTIALGTRGEIPLADEIALAERYLTIEQVRFGPRLAVDVEADETSRACWVPPLVLQPLVENAITHGIAHLIDGGAVRIEARRDGEYLEVAVENPCDPDRRPGSGAGVGLANVRARLEALFGRRGRVAVREGGDRFRVELTLPVSAPAAARGDMLEGHV